jgi:hypothetical protein
MGLYAEHDLNGNPLPVKGKADALVASGAKIISNIITWDDSWPGRLICVVQNGIFDAAAIVTNFREFDRFRRGMAGRMHHWVVVPDAFALVPLHTPDPRD